MIRDPSDGSVREPPKAEAGILVTKPKAGNIPVIETGLRQPTRTDAQQRLERSREWLKNYHAEQGATNARGSNDTEHQADGRSGNDQGEGQS